MDSATVKSTDDNITEEDYENVEDRPSIYRKTASDSTLYPQSATIQESNILHHNFGFLYPIPQSLKSPQILAFQNGLSLQANRIFTSA